MFTVFIACATYILMRNEREQIFQLKRPITRRLNDTEKKCAQGWLKKHNFIEDLKNNSTRTDFFIS